MRRLADLAWQGATVRLHLQVRRFCCMAASCRRRTFTERLPTFAPPHARRTGRRADLVTRVGLALGGEAGARLLPALGAATSAATVLRLVRRVPDPPAPLTRVLGVDDWARRKGHSYGTVLVDLERRRPFSGALFGIHFRRSGVIHLGLHRGWSAAVLWRDRDPGAAGDGRGQKSSARHPTS